VPLLLFSLRGVPEDEAEEVRDLLASNEVNFYETSAGPWGISAPAIWLRDEKEFPRAKSLMDEYQKERFTRKRAEHQQLKREGKRRTLRHVLREDPLRFILYIAMIAAVLYFSIKPFLAFGA
jgi:Family of unknown function (DUF6164)